MIIINATVDPYDMSRGSREITGNSLRTYLYLASHGPSELREVQRGLSFSTPSLASYHLAKLTQLGYVGQDQEGRYVVVAGSSNEILEGYAKVGSALVPQLFFFSVLFTILVAYFSLQAILNPSYTLYLVVTSISMTALLWLETARLWRRLVVETGRKEPE